MKNDLEKKLEDFAIDSIRLKPTLTSSFEADHLYTQFIRSATSAPLNYAESQGSESRRDFIHKLHISFKELKESKSTLRIMIGAGLVKDVDLGNKILDENLQLIAILGKAISTAKKRSLKVQKTGTATKNTK